MFSSLSADVPVPPWDREVFLAIQDALLGLPRGGPSTVISLLNSSAEVYRSVVADGPAEREALLDCLAGRGFQILHRGDQTLARLPELAGALRA